ncbi:MAG: CAP domain-containing protein [Sphingomicrobium sp.]
MLAPSLPRDVEILALHNSERRRIGVPAMHWDPALAASARAYAHVLASSGRFAHSPNASRPGQGENLWRGTRGGYRVAEMVGGWLDERSLFRPGLFPNVSANGRWTDVAHYTQIVWRGSTGLGCGLASSDRFDVLVCRYAPAGNVVGAAVPGSPPPIRR